jgi:hypothetical protein
VNREDIIRMAREAGIEAEADTLCRYEGFVEPLERFASLIFEQGRQQGMKQEHALWMLAKTGQEIEGNT